MHLDAGECHFGFSGRIVPAGKLELQNDYARIFVQRFAHRDFLRPNIFIYFVGNGAKTGRTSHVNIGLWGSPFRE